MEYQLVLQWPAASLREYDDMIWVEEAIMKELPKSALVDGHDAGSGEINIFVLTSDPQRTFAEIRRILGSRDFMIGLKAAFRKRSGTQYTIVWPPDESGFTVA